MLIKIIIAESPVTTTVIEDQEVPAITRKGLRERKKEMVLVKGKNNEPFLYGEDAQGRGYMVDKYGYLYYDSGIEDVGWYVVCI